MPTENKRHVWGTHVVSIQHSAVWDNVLLCMNSEAAVNKCINQVKSRDRVWSLWQTPTDSQHRLPLDFITRDTLFWWPATHSSDLCCTCCTLPNILSLWEWTWQWDYFPCIQEMHHTLIILRHKKVVLLQRHIWEPSAVCISCDCGGSFQIGRLQGAILLEHVTPRVVQSGAVPATNRVHLTSWLSVFN